MILSTYCSKRNAATRNSAIRSLKHACYFLWSVEVHSWIPKRDKDLVLLGGAGLHNVLKVAN